MNCAALREASVSPMSALFAAVLNVGCGLVIGSRQNQHSASSRLGHRIGRFCDLLGK